MIGHFFGWAFANIAIPYVVPIAFVKGLQALQLDINQGAKERIRITYLLREGQYAMGSVAIASTAMFELFTTDHLLTRTDGVAVLVCLIILTVLNTGVFVLGVAFGGPPVAEAVTQRTTIWDWVKSYRLGSASLILALGVSICAFWSHWISYEHDHPPIQATESGHNGQATPLK